MYPMYPRNVCCLRAGGDPKDIYNIPCQISRLVQPVKHDKPPTERKEPWILDFSVQSIICFSLKHHSTLFLSVLIEYEIITGCRDLKKAKEIPHIYPPPHPYTHTHSPSKNWSIAQFLYH